MARKRPPPSRANAFVNLIALVFLLGLLVVMYAVCPEFQYWVDVALETFPVLVAGVGVVGCGWFLWDFSHDLFGRGE